MSDKEVPNFLSRWSQRKLDETQSNEPLVEKIVPETPAVIDNESDDTTETDVPIWMNKEADPKEQQQALSALFRQPEFQAVDHMNEYDEDFTTFTPLGSIVTREMKRMIQLAEEKTRPVDVVSDEVADTNTNDTQTVDLQQKTTTKKDNDLA